MTNGRFTSGLLSVHMGGHCNILLIWGLQADYGLLEEDL